MSCAVVTCRDHTSQPFPIGDSVDEGEGNTFNATRSPMIAEHIGLKMALRYYMFGKNSQGYFEGNNMQKCVEMLIMAMLQCRAFLEVLRERIDITPSRGWSECHELPAGTFLSAVTMRREYVGIKRRDIMKAHPTVCGPWDTAASMLQSLSTSTGSAYERHGYTLPILANVKGLSVAAERCVCNKRGLLNGQSSPGTLQVGQHPSKGTRQIPHTSSSGSPFSSDLPVSHCHWAMACHCLTMTFMV